MDSTTGFRNESNVVKVNVGLPTGHSRIGATGKAGAFQGPPIPDFTIFSCLSDDPALQRFKTAIRETVAKYESECTHRKVWARSTDFTSFQDILRARKEQPHVWSAAEQERATHTSCCFVFLLSSCYSLPVEEVYIEASAQGGALHTDLAKAMRPLYGLEGHREHLSRHFLRLMQPIVDPVMAYHIGQAAAWADQGRIFLIHPDTIAGVLPEIQNVRKYALSLGKKSARNVYAIAHHDRESLETAILRFLREAHTSSSQGKRVGNAKRAWRWRKRRRGAA